MPPFSSIALAGAAGILLLASMPSSSAEGIAYRSLVEPILSSGETAVGEPIAYPTGAPARVTAVIVTVPPGGETGWHTHPVPVFGYVLEGELVVDYGPRGQRTFRAGEGLLDAMATRHNGRNPGTAPLRILAVYLGAEGRANAEAAGAPGDPAAGPSAQ